MKYIYGPVKSRRLGLSLGITLTPYKACCFDCVYCQLGRTNVKTAIRQEYIPVDAVMGELRQWLQYHPQEAKELQCVTFSGSGEPTLHDKIGVLISQVKTLFAVPVVVITNASFLHLAEVRQSLLAADVVIPSLDAVTQDVFEKIDRPLPGMKVEEIIEGLVLFSKEFKGKIWLEIMLVKGINDSLEHARKLAEVIERINPEKIQLNSPVRATAEDNILSVEKNRLEKIQEILGGACEIV